MIRIRPADVLFAFMVMSAAAGYAAGKNDALGKIQAKIDAANDRRAMRNAQIMLSEYQRTMIPAKAENAPSQA